MTDEVDACVQPMQPPRANSLLDRSSPKPNFFELAPVDHPMLPLGDLDQPSIVIASPRKSISKMTFRGLDGHPANVTGAESILGRGLCRLSRGRRA
jgi:hypothetical protein